MSEEINSEVARNSEENRVHIKCGFVALVGRPSVGKSTLLNKMCGEKVAIVSKVPQTTRNAIRGIVNREQGQLIFVDTPGRHNSQKKFNKKLMEVSLRAVEECDIVLYVLDACRAPGDEEEETASLLVPLAEKTLAAVNKMDAPGADYKRTEEFISKNFPAFASSSAGGRILAVSANTGQGVEELLCALFDMAPEGDSLYGGEYYTDQETGFRIAEIIREQAINRLRQELPHSLYVDIADMEFKEKETKLWVRAFIVVERESQKGMVVGKGGEMIKTIRLAALKELKLIFDWKIDLDLRVKTGKDWRHNDHTLRKIIDR
ncbi:MAG: GTPase Era [Treponema sp.]|jgi:GTP-binding protein Era|nr:GTPase Era [Treponema sp.]